MSRSPEPPTSRSKRTAAGTDTAPRARGRGAPVAEATKRPRVEREPAPVEPSPFERGARVSVLKGPFAGKVGVVQELDGKGGARVMLGLLAVRLDVKNLVSAVEGRGRPRLSSSHRKPLPARS
jgi:transcription antitermination factor NusG